MKGIKKAYPLAAIFLGAALTTALASSTAPGSESDPLVSKSYVDGKFDELMSTIHDAGGVVPIDYGEIDTEDIITDIMARLEYEEGLKANFTPVEVKKGSYLIGMEGTEIILRTGRAFAYSKTENGVSDLTSGKDLANGEAVTKNHYLVIPRDDGRGVIPISNCWFLVKGDYQVR
ncbi:MAG: hypothetical protein LBV08_04360 [Clostridiales bacterium]|nr:hypothetical protein [Clostridiales bacterium]